MSLNNKNILITGGTVSIGFRCAQTILKNYSPNIIAVCKTFPIKDILPLINHGHIHFGENKVQEAIEKWSTIKNDSETLKKGFQHYQKSCSKCHGMDHEGSFEAAILNDTTWIYPNNRETLFKIISEGTPNKKMRGWNTKLKTEDIQALTLYILSLQKKELPN